MLGTGPVLTIPGLYAGTALTAGDPSGLSLAGGSGILGLSSGLPAVAGTVDIGDGFAGVPPQVVSSNQVSLTRLDVIFDNNVIFNAGSTDPSDAFQLPVASDTFGTAPTMAIDGGDATKVIITLDGDAVITALGTFDPGVLTGGSPSGIDVASSQTIILSELGSAPAAPNAQAVDVGIDTSPPAVLGVYYDDVDDNNDKNVGDKIIMYFDRDVKLFQGASDMVATFSNTQDDTTHIWLPVTSDALNSSGTEVLVSDGTAGDNQIEINIGDNPTLLVAGVFDDAFTDAGAPSGIGFGNTCLVESISLVFVPALMGNAADIEPGNLPAGFVEVADPQYDPTFGNEIGAFWQPVNLLSDGTVITAGGLLGNGSAGWFTSEITQFDPVTEIWTTKALMSANDGSNFPYYIFGHSGTKLANDSIVYAGGVGVVTAGGFQGPSNYIMMYNPSNETFVQLPNRLNIPRYYHEAALLPSGNILLAGGVGCPDGSMFSPAELINSWVIIDPNDGAELASGDMGVYRRYGTMHMIGGRAVYLGGIEGTAVPDNVVNTILEFDCAAETWQVVSPAADMGAVNFFFQSTLISATELFFNGGVDDGSMAWGTQSGLVWTDGGSVAASINTAASWRFSGTASLLSSGSDYVLIAGGADETVTMLTYAELFDVSTNKFWPNQFPLNQVRRLHKAIVLQDGTIILVGGAANYSTYTNTSGAYSSFGTQITERFWFR
ncbi:MAG: hypothetical protein E3J72_20035 [Planctomycetota bacterium]|nr:MAG: hypothetical protein E3J72_20035 [Planctomycetota bacterium]